MPAAPADLRTLSKAIKAGTIPYEKLSEAILDLMRNNDGAAEFLVNKLMSQPSKEDEEDNSDIELISGGGSSSSKGKGKAKGNPDKQERVVTWQTCKNCKETYDASSNDDDTACRYHSGTLEVHFDDDAWDDHDENCHGRYEDCYGDNPEGFLWNCCDQSGDVLEGCEYSIYVPQVRSAGAGAANKK